ncbi:hypothetical protein BDZ45DRAFT_688278 [Acephala macrosclerotiorum]|nr:hypothetical protein BDZ45DRAFT_688278 [Acephala macrosclerotiorum]
MTLEFVAMEIPWSYKDIILVFEIIIYAMIILSGIFLAISCLLEDTDRTKLEDALENPSPEETFPNVQDNVRYSKYTSNHMVERPNSSSAENKIRQLENRVDDLVRALRATQEYCSFYKNWSTLLETVIKQRQKVWEAGQRSFPKETEQSQIIEHEHRESNANNAEDYEKDLGNSGKKTEAAVSTPEDHASRDQRASSSKDTRRLVTFISATKPQIADTNMPSNDPPPMDGAAASHESEGLQTQQDPAEPTDQRDAREPQNPHKVPDIEGHQNSPKLEEPHTAEVKTKKAHRGRRGGKRHKKGKGKSAEHGEKSRDVKDIDDGENNEEQNQESDEEEWEVVDGLAEDVKEQL